MVRALIERQVECGVCHSDHFHGKLPRNDPFGPRIPANEPPDPRSTTISRIHHLRIKILLWQCTSYVLYFFACVVYVSYLHALIVMVFATLTSSECSFFILHFAWYNIIIHQLPTTYPTQRIFLKRWNRE
jgi:hypothetical protein